MKSIISLILILPLSLSVYGQPLSIEPIEFISRDTKLSGSIVLPSSEVRAAVVFVHGSGKQTRNLNIAQQFAKNGIAALVYDKRGVGESGGDYESKQSVSEANITLLTDDAVAALAALASHPKLHRTPLGLTGISQAGWIVPLAAEKTSALDFMVIWSGPVTKVSEEDIFSKYTADLDGNSGSTQRRVPSYNEALKARKRPYVWPDFLGKDSNPSDSLVKLAIPGLWIFGAQDGSIPVDLSIKRLNKLSGQGLPYSYVLFSDLGHNNMTETFATTIDWIHRTAKGLDE